MKKLFFIVSLIFISGLCNIISSDNIDYGLFIKAFPYNDQDKTSLALENNQPLKLGKETTMSFFINVRKDNAFGVVFRIITDKKENVDLMFTVGDKDKRYPMLVINESVFMISEEIVCDQWIPCSITLSSEKNEISIVYNNTKLSVPHSLAETKNALISFGLCPLAGYSLYDIASVNIRDINIFDKKELIRSWKLREHDGLKSFDSVANIPAITSNPRWITDMYASWEKIYSKQIKANSLFSFNPNENLLYIIDPDSKNIITFDPERRNETTTIVKSGVIAANAPNQVFYNPEQDLLFSYNLDENTISRFSFENSSWDSHIESKLDHGYWNNSTSYSEADSTIVSFGGYGFYKYNNELIRLHLNHGSINKSNLLDIPPRHSASTAIIGNTLYIFGGRGNKSGRQELSPKNYYDFYSVNLLTEQTNKLWENKSEIIDFLPSENMIFDEKENCFYIFATKDGGTLLRIEKDKAGYTSVSHPIQEDLNAHYLYTNLYFSSKLKKFYALVNKIKTDGSAEVSIYSLSYPPAPIVDSVINEQSSDHAFSFSFKLVILIVLGLIGFIGLIYFRYRKRLSSKISNTKLQDTLESNKTDTQEKKIETSYYDFSKQSICFLGGFSVSDKDGQNITGQFTPMLKYLLILLILHTVKESKGISGNKLIQLLWFDKNDESAKNNRNVYLSKLRTVLENVGECTIINQNGFWSISFGENIKCDYIETMKLFSLIKENKSSTPSEINKLVELLLKGVFLPNTEADWIDNFKSDFSNLTIDTLTSLSSDGYEKLSDELKLKIADILFLHDYINEEALYLKCSIFFNSGKKGIAKGIYDNFCKEYLNLLGSKYKYSLSDVISRKNITK